jgi:hypothetical protein
MPKLLFLLIFVLILQNVIYAEGAWEPATLPVFQYRNRGIPYRGYHLGFNRMVYAIDPEIVERKYGAEFIFGERNIGYNFTIRLNWDYEIVGPWEGGMGEYEYIKTYVWDKENPDKKYGVICEKPGGSERIAGIMLWYIHRWTENVIQRHGKLLTESDIAQIGGKDFLEYYKNYNIVNEELRASEILKRKIPANPFVGRYTGNNVRQGRNNVTFWEYMDFSGSSFTWQDEMPSSIAGTFTLTDTEITIHKLRYSYLSFENSDEEYLEEYLNEKETAKYAFDGQRLIFWDSDAENPILRGEWEKN